MATAVKSHDEFNLIQFYILFSAIWISRNPNEYIMPEDKTTKPITITKLTMLSIHEANYIRVQAPFVFEESPTLGAFCNRIFRCVASAATYRYLRPPLPLAYLLPDLIYRIFGRQLILYCSPAISFWYNLIFRTLSSPEWQTGKTETAN